MGRSTLVQWKPEVSGIRDVFGHLRDSGEQEDRSEKSFGTDTALSSIALDECL